MTRGRKPKPTEQKRIEGNPGKRPLPDDEPQLPVEAPDPPEWLDAAERTLEGMAERHPSRTVILVPKPEEAESRIVVSAHEINEGRMPELSRRDGDFYFFKATDATAGRRFSANDSSASRARSTSTAAPDSVSFSRIRR